MAAKNERELLIQHMEAILCRLGEQDLKVEDLRLRAEMEDEPNARAALMVAAENGIAKLNLIAHEAIELGRALYLRPGTVAKDIPTELPPSLKHERSDYKGEEGVHSEEPQTITFSAPGSRRGPSN